MTKAEARRLVAACAARIIESGGHWTLYENEDRAWSIADQQRISDALRDLVSELDRRACPRSKRQ